MKHSSVIEQLGGPRQAAQGLGLNERRVRGWRDRDSIPSKYWPAVIRLAEAKGVDVTYEGLVGAVSAAAA